MVEEDQPRTQFVAYTVVQQPANVSKQFTVNRASTSTLTRLALRGYRLDGGQLFTYGSGKPPELFLIAPDESDAYHAFQFPQLRHYHVSDGHAHLVNIVMR